MKRLLAIILLLICAAAVSAQTLVQPSTGGAGITITNVAGLSSVSGKTNGTIAVVTNGSSGSDCTVGGGSTVVNCQYNGSTWVAISATATFPAITTGNNTTAAMGVSTGATLVPAEKSSAAFLGQVTGTNDWLSLANGVAVPIAPTLATNTTGGAIVTGAITFVRVTYVGLSAALPSGESQVTAVSCSGGNQCSTTVTMPTSCTAGNLPTGATGCTVWDSIVGVNQEFQQTASNNCVNITTATCVIGTAGAGAALTGPADLSIKPPGAQANTCPDFINPTSYIQKEDGNYYPLWGVDTTSINSANPIGIFTLCDHLFFNDTASAPLIANAGVSIHHQMGNLQIGGTASPLYADFALGVEDIDINSTKHTWEQSLTQYNERQVFDNSFVCSPTGSETCVGSLRAIVADQRTSGNLAVGGMGMVGVSGVVFKQAVGGTISGSSHPYTGVYGLAQNSVTQNLGGIFFVGVEGIALEAGACTACGGWSVVAGKGTNLASGNTGFYAQNFNTGRTIDFAMQTEGGNILFGNTADSPLYFHTINSNAGTINQTGSLAITGDISTTAFTTQVIGVITPTLGSATSWTYQVGCVGGAGGIDISTTANTAAGAANLDGTHFNTVNFTRQVGCTSYNIYLNATGGTCSSGSCGAPGLIGNVATPFPGSGTIAGLTSTLSFVHNGQTVSSSGIPTTNSTGTIATPTQVSAGTAGGLPGLVDKTIGITTAAMGAQSSASCTNVTNMTWTVAANKNYVLQCEIPITLATSATVGFCLGGPGTATSYSLMADGPIGASAVYAQVNTLAQTAWGTKTGSSSAVGAAEWVHVRATIRNGATASGTPLTLQTFGNGTNNLTVGADASCTLTQAN